MPKLNKIIEALKNGPCTLKELPYRPSNMRMSVEYRHKLRRIYVSGRKEKKGGSYGMLNAVYYLEGSEYNAISKFVEVNFDVLNLIDLRKNNYIHSGLPKGMGSKVIDEFKRQKHDRRN